MAIGSPQWMYASGEDFTIDQSLRFNDDDSAYLSWTPSSAGNRRTFTWSGWVKRSKIGGQQTIFLAYGADNNLGYNPLIFTTGNQLALGGWSASWLVSTALFRDPSAWLHIVLAVDTTDGTADNRIKLYVNGTQLTDFATRNNPSQNDDFAINNTVEHNIGSRDAFDSSDYTDGYLAEVNFIDGQALTPADFGETGTYGEWKPIEYSGTYGTNGFYLPFKQDYTVEGFSTVTYKGTGATQYIGGTGFQPDFTWIKRRNSIQAHSLIDAVRGGNKMLESQSTGVEASLSGGMAFKPDGFTLDHTGGWNEGNADGDSYVAWNWDMGGSNATNTDGSITSTVRANPTYGQSIVSYTGNGSDGATVGHGLSSAPDMVIVKSRDSVHSWSVGHVGLGTNEVLLLNSSNPKRNCTSDFSGGGVGARGASTFTLEAGTVDANNVNTNNEGFIAYCFHSVTGYSKFGSYTGTGSNVSVTTGFAPAFTIVKRADSADSWFIFDNTREPDGVVDLRLEADTSAAEATVTTGLTYTSTGFTVTSTNGAFNASGGTYIYMAFADKREYAYWLDQSGNNNDWTSNNLTESDISVDSPTNNFATWNPLVKHTNVATTYAEGNLKATKAATYWTSTLANMYVDSGKWYAEFCCLTDGVYMIFGINAEGDLYANNHPGADSSGYGYGYVFDTAAGRGDITYQDSTVSTGGAFNNLAVGTIIGITLDFDNNQVKFYANNVLQYTQTIGARAYTYSVAPHGGSVVANFGQDSSFAGNKVAQGNQDSNDIGDFYYTPPTGFLALCTKNLPDVAVVPSENFNTVLYTGDATTSRTISGAGFAPDLLWGKIRSTSNNHFWFDTLRGANRLISNSSGAEADYSTWFSTLTSDGFTTGTTNANSMNQLNATFVAWFWKANGSGSSNTNGSVTSTVSANVDAGFSIATWTGTSGLGTDTIGHGLSQAPELIISKISNTGDGWYVYHKDLASGSGLQLNTTAAVASSYWASAPTSTVFTEPNDSTNVWEHVTYCFHSVDGYSKVGSYTGNGNADGTFVYTGFRPAWIMLKVTSAAGQRWELFDTTRSTINPSNHRLSPNESSAEVTGYNSPDILSNGFKFRGAAGYTNDSGETYIYIAFAETPFKNSNAR